MRIFEGYTKGVNLGGWLSQCKHSIMHYDTFITEKDVALLSTWGIDHLRVPIDFVFVVKKASLGSASSALMTCKIAPTFC